MTRISLLSTVALLLLGPGCTGRQDATRGGATDDVAATVNGAAIRAADLELEAGRSNPHDAGVQRPAEERVRNVLESIIRRELAAQRAVALGLDAEPGYAEELRQRQAQLDSWRRQRLSDLLYGSLAAKKQKVTDDDARRYFDENQKLVRTELRIEQLLARNEQAVTAARAELEAGASFEQVYAKYVGPVPEGSPKPWDLGFLRWTSVPEPWRRTLKDLKPGELSSVIRGPNNRFWIIRVVDARENAALGFEDVKPWLLEYLQADAAVRAREQLDRELRTGARIEYAKELPALIPRKHRADEDEP